MKKNFYFELRRYEKKRNHEEIQELFLNTQDTDREKLDHKRKHKIY